MPKRSTSKLRPLWTYLRELSIVILGVAVTLTASSLITRSQEKKDLQLQLSAIYSELEENLDRTEKLSAFCFGHNQLQKLLMESINDTSAAMSDSLEKYSYLVGRVHPFTYKKGAYEMFLQSGAMKNLRDRELLRAITESYASLEIAKFENDSYCNNKMQEINKLYTLESKMILHQIDLRQKEFRGIVNFFIAVSGRGYYSEQAIEQIKAVLAQRKEK